MEVHALVLVRIQRDLRAALGQIVRERAADQIDEHRPPADMRPPQKGAPAVRRHLRDRMQHHRRGQQAIEVGADQHARDVRHDEPDPADDAADRDHGGGHQGRAAHHQRAQPARSVAL